MLPRTWSVLRAILSLFSICNAVIVISADAKDRQNVPVEQRKNYDTKLEAQLKVACTRIKLAGEELEKVVQADPNANPAVSAAAGYLFHQGNHGDVAHNLNFLYQICGGIRLSDKRNERTMDIPQEGEEGYVPAMDERWKRERRKADDIIIYTSAERFVKDTKTNPPYDLTWDYELPPNIFAEIFNNPNTKLLAYTLDKSQVRTNDESPDIMQLSPGFLQKKIDDVQPKTCKDLESKAQSVVAMFNNAKKKTADAYVDMPHVLAHELMHTKVGGKAKDPDEPNCYGWANCVRIKDPKNADSLAFMTTMTWIIIKCGFQPNQDGSISKIKGWKAPS